MKYVCPFCYKKMPDGYEQSSWSCCGEVGHATILPECPKCGAENIDLPLVACEVCGWAATPRTDEVAFRSGMEHEYVEAEFARKLERELNAALELLNAHRANR